MADLLQEFVAVGCLESSMELKTQSSDKDKKKQKLFFKSVKSFVSAVSKVFACANFSEQSANL